jgi:hypothetical protein
MGQFIPFVEGWLRNLWPRAIFLKFTKKRKKIRGRGRSYSQPETASFGTLRISL